MASYNRVILLGNLTRDPEVKYLPSGTAVVDMGLAVSSRYKTQSGEMKEDVCFVTCAVFGKQAENCGQYLKKGRQVLLEGRLQYEQWEKDGQKRSALKVVADRVQFLGGKGEPGGRGESGGDEAAASAPRSAPKRAAAAEVPAAGGEAAADDDNLPF